MRISEDRVAPVAAREVRLLCPHCNGFAYARIPYYHTALVRQQLIREAMEEHRRVCPNAHAEDGRVVRIEYPRQ